MSWSEAVGRRTGARAMARAVSWTQFWGKESASLWYHPGSQNIRVCIVRMPPGRTNRTRAELYLPATCTVLRGACALIATSISQAIVPAKEYSCSCSSVVFQYTFCAFNNELLYFQIIPVNLRAKSTWYL